MIAELVIGSQITSVVNALVGRKPARRKVSVQVEAGEPISVEGVTPEQLKELLTKVGDGVAPPLDVDVVTHAPPAQAPSPAPAPPQRTRAESRKLEIRPRQRELSASTAVMQIVVSVVALGAGIVFLSIGDSGTKTAAAGWIGLVVGYWLR